MPVLQNSSAFNIKQKRKMFTCDGKKTRSNVPKTRDTYYAINCEPGE